MSAPFAPKFLIPDPDGSLSNSTTPTFKMRYASSRGSADPAGQAQFVGTRVGQAGVLSQTPQTVLRSGWWGTPTTTPLPTALVDAGIAQIATGPGQGQLGDVEGRIYVTGGKDTGGTVHAEVWSAPYNGGSIGSWRQERSLVAYTQTGSGAPTSAPRAGHGCCIATFGQAGGSGQAGLGRGGVTWLLCYGGIDGTNTGANASLLGAPILADGTLAPWQTLSLGGWTPLVYCRLLAIPSPYLTTGLVLSGGCASTVATATAQSWITAVRGAPASSKVLSDWDTPGGWWQPLPTPAHPAICGHFVHFDWANGTLMLSRGTNNAGTSQTGTWYLPLNIDISSWNVNPGSVSWTAATTSGTNAVANNCAGLYFGAQNAGTSGLSPLSWIYIFGGTTSTTVTDRASAVGVIQIGTVTWTAGNVPNIVWATASNPLSPAQTGHGIVVGDHLAIGAFPFPPWVDDNYARISTLGGANAGSVALTTARSSTVPYNVGGFSPTAWVGGVGGGLVSADLGTGGVVAASTAPDAPAGAQDITHIYGNLSAPAPLAAGDLVQFAAQFTDKQGGDPSPFKTSIIRIGNAPTVTGLSVSTLTNGQPVLSLAFNAGTGGQGEASWRATVTRNSDSVVVFDSGVRIDQQNQVQVQLAPMLTNVLYNVLATVTSLDVPVPGATDTATASISFTPTLAAAPAAPTSVSASSDATGKWALLNYTTQAGTTVARIYHRLTTVGGAFTLLAEIASTVGAQSVKLMDRLEIGTAYDFYVSSLGASSNMESAASATVSTTIPADAASPSAYLHIAGQPLGTALGVQVQMQTWPKMQAVYQAKVVPRYNAARPVGRQGILNYRTLDIEFMSVHSANLPALEAIVDALLAGAVCFYRDRRGTCFPCILTTPEDVQFLYPDHTALTLRLVQVDDLYSPYLSNGSALGIPTLAAGTLPPLRRASLVA